MWGRGGSCVNDSAQELGDFHMAKLDEISKLVSNDARSMSKHLKEGNFSIKKIYTADKT